MADNKPQTSIAFSWLATLKHLGLGIIVAAVGFVMLQVETPLIWFLGLLAMITGVGIVIMVPFTGGVQAGPCPICGAKIEVLMKSGSYIECAKCLEYLDAVNGTLKQMDEAHVADEPRFKVRLPWWDDLRAPTGATITIGDAKDYVTDRVREAVLTRTIPDRTVSASWPEACCICGSEPTRHETLAQEVNVGPEGVGGVRDRKIVVRVEGIPHCSQHKKGVKLSESPGECGRVLFFRSYAYRNAFRRANPWEITWS